MKKASKAKRSKRKNVPPKTRSVATNKPKKSFHVTSRSVSERELIGHLNEDLQDAWQKLRAFGTSLGEQRIYASHNSIMFSKKICYFFVRPRKSFLETWIFLPRKIEGLKATRSAKKIEKYCNLFKLVHADQVEEPLTDWLREAYDFAPSNPRVSEPI